MAGKVPPPSGFVNLAITVSCREPFIVTISEENAGVAVTITMSPLMTMSTAIPLLFTFMSPIRKKIIVKGETGIALTKERIEVPPRGDNPSEASYGQF